MEAKLDRETDWNALVRAGLLLAFTAYVARLILKGDIGLYVHPRFTWFTASAGLGLLLMAGGQLVRGVRGVTGNAAPLRGGLYAVCVAVLCVGFVIQPHTFGADLAAKQGLNITNRSGNKSASPAPVQAAATQLQSTANLAPPTTSPGPPTTSPGPSTASPEPPITSPGPSTASPGPSATSAGSAAALTPSPAPEPPASAPSLTLPESVPAPPKKTPVQLSGNTAVVTAQNFVSWMAEFYNDPGPYTGKRVVLEGFAFHPPGAGAEEFAVTRLVVTCHVAHAAPDGLLATLSGKAPPAQDTWHRVEGVLEAVKFNGTDTLRIRIDKITPIARPTDPYVYG